MAKYIDLLREHQKKGKKGKSPSADDTDTPDMESSGEHQALEAMLADDTMEGTTDDFSTAGKLPNEELLADEESIEEGFSSTYAPAEPSSKKPAPPPEDAHEITQWLAQCTIETGKLFSACSSNSAIDFHPLIEQLNRFLKRLEGNIKLIDALELVVSEREKQVGEFDSDIGGLIQKSIMMMLYAIKMGLRLDFNTDELRSHILAAMVHHIGMAQISPEIRNKKEKLTKDEIKEIRTASKKSHDYLTLCGITDAAVLQAASQAQERYDGSGPQGLAGSGIAYSARMIGLLSMFEALIHYRPYRNRLLPRDAIRELVNHHKKAFDPNLLKALIESISLYPVGTYVQLNSGDIGLVIQVHHRLPLRPVVRIMFDSSGGKIPVREIDLKVQPNLMVQRCMYEEGIKELGNTEVQENR